MSKYKFYIDKKHTMWLRSFYEIEATSKEQAVLKMESQLNLTYTDLPIEPEYALEVDYSYEEMTPRENDGQPTAELYWHDGEFIANNMEA